MNYSAFERSGIELIFWSGESLTPRAPFFKILVSFSSIAASRPFCISAACTNNRILLGFVAQELVVEGYMVGFFIDQRLLRKLDLAKN